MNVPMEEAMKRNPLVILCVLVLLVLSVPASAKPAPLCGFRCNVEHFDFCIYTGEVRYQCYQIYGGCVSGTSVNCDDDPVF